MDRLFYFRTMDTKLFQLFYESSGVCTDTRNITKDCLFICIKGENFDGNTFAKDALVNGAKSVILDNPQYYDPNGNMFLVENSVLYLQKLANFHRNKFDIPVVGITGSNGKTTSKELITAVLSQKFNVLSTIGNLNNHLGVPFTLLRLNHSHEIAIIEMGANHPGDIAELCEIAEPDFGLITNIGKAHLEGFRNFEGVLNTKKELYDCIENKNGTIVVNSDDEVLTNILSSRIKKMTYGTVNADITGTLLRLSPFVEMKWSDVNHVSDEIRTRLVGKYNFYNFLAAIAFGRLFKIEPDLISEAIETYEPTNKRSQVKKTDKNTLILDCYNANPSSMKVALESFSQNENPEKLLILGGMKELGIETATEHQKVIQYCEQLNLSGYFVGPEFANIKSDALIEHFESTEDLIEQLKSNPISGKLILLKGSRGIALEKLEDWL